MSIRVEVSGGPSGAVRVCGADSRLGAWEPARAFQLTLSGDTWGGEFPLPEGGSEFKLISVQDEAVQWEPLEANRRWPETGLSDGNTFKLRYGEPKMQIEASAGHMEANARATIKKLVERQGSALQENVDTKGENAYYHAHTRHFEVPEDAKVITGPGLITGGRPVLIEAGAAAVDPAAEERTVWMKEYSWADTKAKVKVYVPVPEGLLPSEGADAMVETQFKALNVELTVKSAPRQRLRLEKLHAELKTDACSTRVEPGKNRIVLQLVKQKEVTWSGLTK
jgi:hypothetical protein